MRPWIVGSVWVLTCLAASYPAMRADFLPGMLGAKRTAWPAETSHPSGIRRPSTTTAVAFIHPRCPCTKGTITQLLRVMASHPAAAVTVAVYTPAAMKNTKAWEGSAYVARIRKALPRAAILFDRDGVEAQRFGVFTSGTVLVYDRAGRELFRGGITDRRGGEGDNRGVREFAATLQDGRAVQSASTPVFGCSLVTLNAQSPGGLR